MRNGFSVRPTTILAMLLGAPLAGCWTGIALNNAKHMTIDRATAPRVERRFRVVDAADGAPVPTARLVVTINFDWMDDWTRDATTDADGIATLSLEKDYLAALVVSVDVAGYNPRGGLYVGGTNPSKGVGSPSDDPIEIRLHRLPAAQIGIRVPTGFRGTLVCRSAPTKYDFPTTLPPDRRVWWTNAVTDGGETTYEVPPTLGDGGGNERVVALGDSLIPTPSPGDRVDGIAAWRVGNREPAGPWGGVREVLVIGDRVAALDVARREYASHHNGRTGFIYDGWLAEVDPAVKRWGEGYSVTRSSLR